MKNNLIDDKELETYFYFLSQNSKELPWCRRYYDYSRLGLFGYLKKRIFKKNTPKDDSNNEIKLNEDIEFYSFFLEKGKRAHFLRHYYDYKTLTFWEYIKKHLHNKSINQ